MGEARTMHRPAILGRVDPSETGRLLRAAMNGTPEALEHLLERIRPRLLLWAAARMSPRLRALIDPEDVAQEVLLAVHKDLGGFCGGEDPGAFLGWMFRIGENRIRDLVDHHGSRKRRPRETPQAASRTSPSRAVARSDQIETVRRAIEDLPEDYRLVIRLRRLEELETDRVAEVMGRSDNAVRILYYRALKALRERLGGAA